MTITPIHPGSSLPFLNGRPVTFLTRPEFQKLAAVPAELEWFANLDNPRTRRAYKIDLREFMDFASIHSPTEMRDVRRAYIIAWGKDLEFRGVAGSTILRKLAALSSLFEYLCEKNAVETSPVKRREAPEGGGLRRQDTGLRRSPGAQTPRGAGD